MRPRRLSEVARAVDGRLLGEDPDVVAVVTDSRAVTPGALFVALAGERADGAAFVSDAFDAGAAGALVPEGRYGPAPDGPVVLVRSTREALLRLAADERGRIEAPVVAVTGANGKTSTKDLAAAVLRRRYRVHASPGSFNNEIGLPLTLLGTPPGAQIVVAEMGARRAGDVALLCEVARPDVAVVTNVGVAHLEVFGSWEAIVEASAEPVEFLGPDGTAILNADDQVVAGYVPRCRGRVVTFGVAERADVRAERVALDGDGRAAFDLVHRGRCARVSLAVPGQHMVSNALAAAAVGLAFDVDVEACAAALGVAGVSPWRMETFTTSDGVRVLNDAYNANPESMTAALRAARWMAAGARLIAVLGGMAELGPISADEHERLGRLAARIRVDRLITVGGTARAIAAAAAREGIGPDDVASYDDPDQALADARRSAAPGDVVLFKGSRVVGLERLAEAMR